MHIGIFPLFDGRLVKEKKRVTASDKLVVNLPAGGGEVIHLQLNTISVK